MSVGDVSLPRLLLVAVAVAVAVAGVHAVSTSSAAFSVYNDDWDGTSDLRSTVGSDGTDADAVRDTAAYSAVRPDGTVAFVFSPESSYSPDEMARLSEFVRSGGTLVVAKDFGPGGDELLRGLGASARFDGRPLRDAQSNYRSPLMPVATEVADHPLAAGVESVTLNHGTAVKAGEATPLVNTSRYAYLDADGDGELDDDEMLASRPVATVEPVGDGRVVVVGDPSVFINAMLDRPGNRQFARSLVAGHRTLLLDYSHAESALPPLVLAVLVVRQSALLQLGVGALAVGTLAVWSRRPSLGSGIASSDSGGRVWGRVRKWLPLSRRGDATVPPDASVSTAELVAYLERQHPEWDRERVERMVAALERRREE